MERPQRVSRVSSAFSQADTAGFLVTGRSTAHSRPDLLRTPSAAQAEQGTIAPLSLKFRPWLPNAFGYLVIMTVVLIGHVVANTGH